MILLTFIGLCLSAAIYVLKRTEPYLDEEEEEHQVASVHTIRGQSNGHSTRFDVGYPGRGSDPYTDDDIKWLSALFHAQHALIIGQTGAGKTVLTHAIATTRSRSQQRVVVCDPDARPGMWYGCEVVGGGDDFEAIEVLLQQIQQEIEVRRQQRAAGLRDFPSLTLVLSEASDILRECPTARPLFETMLRRARKLNAGLLVDVQDDQVSTLNIEGASKLKVNFGMVAELRRDTEGVRIARINKQDYVVPILPDPERLADEYARKHPDHVATWSSKVVAFPRAVEPTLQQASPPVARQMRQEEKYVRVAAVLNQYPDVSQKKLAELVYDVPDGSGWYSTSLKAIRADVEQILTREVLGLREHVN